MCYCACFNFLWIRRFFFLKITWHIAAASHVAYAISGLWSQVPESGLWTAISRPFLIIIHRNLYNQRHFIFIDPQFLIVKHKYGLAVFVVRWKLRIKHSSSRIIYCCQPTIETLQSNITILFPFFWTRCWRLCYIPRIPWIPLCSFYISNGGSPAVLCNLHAFLIRKCWDVQWWHLKPINSHWNTSHAQASSCMSGSEHFDWCICSSASCRLPESPLVASSPLKKSDPNLAKRYPRYLLVR